MEVIAVAGADHAWRWRILGEEGTIIEESDRSYSNIAIALAQGRARADELSAKSSWTGRNWRRGERFRRDGA
jgi:hypothetical protein